MSFNDTIIEEFRPNGGVTKMFGRGLVLLHTVGAKTGEPRIHPLLGLPQADGSWLIAASAAGSTKHPAWYLNLQANPDATIETGSETVPVTASTLEGSDHDAGWSQFLEAGPSFAGYEEKAAGRIIPVVKLTRR